MTTTHSETGQEAVGRSMKIYFCDLCNESIPLKDINSNRITIEEGKIFCQKCAPKKAHALEQVPGAVLGVVAVLLIGLLVVGAYGWKVASDLDQRQRDLEGALGRATGSLDDMKSRLQAIGQTLETEVAPHLSRVGDDLRTARAELAQRLDVLDRRELEHHEGVSKSLNAAVERVTARLDGDVAALRKDLQALQVDDAASKIVLDSLKDQIELLKEMVRSVSPSGGGKPDAASAPSGDDGAPPPAPPVPAGPDPAALESKEVNALIAQLKDADAGRRFAAVVELGRYSGPLVAKALEGMLADSESYIRQGALQQLRKVSAVAALPAVIASLRDADYFVRVAANAAACSLSGTDLRFNPEGSPSEREAKVKEWERWWDANREKLLK